MWTGYRFSALAPLEPRGRWSLLSISLTKYPGEVAHTEEKVILSHWAHAILCTADPVFGGLWAVTSWQEHMKESEISSPCFHKARVSSVKEFGIVIPPLREQCPSHLVTPLTYAPASTVAPKYHFPVAWSLRASHSHMLTHGWEEVLVPYNTLLLIWGLEIYSFMPWASRKNIAF